MAGGGFRSGGFRSGGFHHGFRHFGGYGGYGYYDPYDYDYGYGYGYPYDNGYPDYAYGDSYYGTGGCYTVRNRVHTRAGWRVKPVQVCG
jgi:hypothetical protein